MYEAGRAYLYNDASLNEESKIEVIPVENIDEAIRPPPYDGKDKMI